MSLEGRYFILIHTARTCWPSPFTSHVTTLSLFVLLIFKHLIYELHNLLTHTRTQLDTHRKHKTQNTTVITALADADTHTHTPT
jgi:hypothetical protein